MKRKCRGNSAINKSMTSGKNVKWKMSEKINCLPFVLVSSCECNKKRKSFGTKRGYEKKIFFATCYKLVRPLHISNGLMTTCLAHHTCVLFVYLWSEWIRQKVERKLLLIFKFIVQLPFIKVLRVLFSPLESHRKFFRVQFYSIKLKREHKICELTKCARQERRKLEI